MGELSTPDRPRLDDLLLELGEMERNLTAILKGGGEPIEQAVWEIYASAEKIAALLKMRLSVESPGRFQELPRPMAGRRLEFLAAALPLLARARSRMKEREAIEALRLIREARGLLRGYLADLRRDRLRRARASRRSSARRPSSS